MEISLKNPYPIESRMNIQKIEYTHLMVNNVPSQIGHLEYLGAVDRVFRHTHVWFICFEVYPIYKTHYKSHYLLPKLIAFNPNFFEFKHGSTNIFPLVARLQLHKFSVHAMNQGSLNVPIEHHPTIRFH